MDWLNAGFFFPRHTITLIRVRMLCMETCTQVWAVKTIHRYTLQCEMLERHWTYPVNLRGLQQAKKHSCASCVFENLLVSSAATGKYLWNQLTTSTVQSCAGCARKQPFVSGYSSASLLRCSHQSRLPSDIHSERQEGGHCQSPTALPDSGMRLF